MDQTMYSLVNGISDKEDVDVSVLVKLAGIQVVAEAEKLGYIETMNDETYTITLAGRFMLLASHDNREISVSYDESYRQMTIDLGYGSDTVEIKARARESGLSLRFTTKDDTIFFDYANIDTLAILAKMFTFFNENVL